MMHGHARPWARQITGEYQLLSTREVRRKLTGIGAADHLTQQRVDERTRRPRPACID
jgi:hypothetical protein